MAEVDVEEFRCFVGGLAWATTDTALADAFKSYGDVIESKVINDRETGRSRGFGFVTFRDEKSMKDAIESMNGMELDGRNITVHQAQQRPTNNGGGFNKNNGRGNERGNYGSERGSERGNYGTERGSERGNYGTERGSERGNYGSERGNFGRRTEGGNFGRRYGGARSDGRSDVDNWRKAD